jgi:hypothetical protein
MPLVVDIPETLSTKSKDARTKSGAKSAPTAKSTFMIAPAYGLDGSYWLKATAQPCLL